MNIARFLSAFPAVVILLISSATAQVPQAFKYEFLLRTYTGSIATSTAINIRISILDGSANGSVVYSETHSKQTDNFGMLSLEVGNGSDKSGDFSVIEWIKGDFYLKMDELGGKNFLLMPTQKLLSVPFALYAQRATNVDDADADPTNEIQQLSLRSDSLHLSRGGGSVDLNLADNQTLQFNDNRLSISRGNEILLPFNFSDTSAFNEIQQLSRNGNVVTLSKGGGSFIDENTRYSAGDGIIISDTMIINTAPSRWSESGNALVYNRGQAGIGTQTPEPSALFDISSSDKGFLPPRMTTTQRNAIPKPAPGLMVFNTESGCLNFFSGSNWIELCGSCTPQPTPANAGADQPLVTGTTTTLAGNTPQTGTAVWSIVSGKNGTINEPANPKSSFKGVSGETYTLKWSISNECGTSSDEVIISLWSCGFPLTDLRDGQIYKTVQIDGQCWMASNMNYGRMISGSTDQLDNATVDKYCYDDNATNCEKYGGLYQWAEAMQHMPGGGKVRGICPDGWHIPTDNEWNTLAVGLGLDRPGAEKTGLRGVDQGTRLKIGGNSGFDALLGGSRLNNGIFYAINNYGNFWTATSEGGKAWRHAVSGNTTGIFRTLNDTKEGLSVRCVKD